MAYVSDSNLTQFWGLAKGYINAEDGRFANWQKTEKAGAVTCWPVGGTELLPTVDFMFTETGPESGDKGPDNPSTITGVSSVKVTRSGKNLMAPTALNYSSRNGLTYTVSADGSVTVSGEASDSTYNNMTPINLPAGTYQLTGCPAGGTSTAYYLQVFGSPAPSAAIRDYGSGSTFTLTQKTTITTSIFVYNGYNASTMPLVFRPQIVAGSEASNYEQAESALTQTVSLGNTYYGGTVDLATGLMTVTHVKVVLTGAEEITWVIDHRTVTTAISAGAPWRSYIPATKTPSSGPVCTHFPFLYSSSSDTVHFYVFSTGGACFWYPDPDMTEAEWKAYLAAQYANGTPVTLCYEVKVPTTLQLSPLALRSLVQSDKYTPRLNTVYTDAQAVQVGYAKSPIRSEYELTQAIIATEGGE